MSYEIVVILVVVLGLFCIFCSVKDYDWFITNSLTGGLLNLIGRKAMRFFFFGFGVLVIILNVFLYFWVD